MSLRCPGYDPPPCRSSPVRPVEGLQQIFVPIVVRRDPGLLLLLLRPSRPARKRLCTVLAGTEAAFEPPADGEERRQRSQRSPECALLLGNFFRVLLSVLSEAEFCASSRGRKCCNLAPRLKIKRRVARTTIPLPTRRLPRTTPIALSTPPTTPGTPLPLMK